MDGFKHIKIGLIVALMILLNSLVSVGADDEFLFRINPITNSISVFDEAEFEVTIISSYQFEEDFSIYSPNIDQWTVRINPDVLTIEPDGSGTTTVKIRPKDAIIPGREYGVQLNVRSKKTSVLKSGYAFVSVKSQEEVNREYAPVLLLEVNELGKINPGETYTLSVEIENKNVRYIKELKVLLSSDVLTKETVTELGPLKKKTIQFPISFPRGTKPIKDNFIIKIEVDDEAVVTKSTGYEIVQVKDFDSEIDASSSFLLNRYNVLLTNTGNVDTTAEYKVKTNFINYYFIRGNAESMLKQVDGKYYKVYIKSLAPDESFQLSIVASYRPVLYVVLAIIVLFILYYTLRSPIVIRKSVSSIKTKEDTLSELKVLLHIKNRTKRTFEDIIILDRIPKIIEMGRDFEIGTIKPAKVMSHEKKGTIAKWEINSIESYEERVVAYKLLTNFNILGGLTLPIAVLKYRKHNGKEKAVSSNKVNLVIKRFEQKSTS